MTTLDDVRIRLDALRAADPAFKTFGSGSHRYRLLAPYPEAELAAFERDGGFTLPDEYRAFITRYGNGGAGPFYGVMPFLGDDPEDHTKYDLLDQPFKYADAWNPTELLDADSDEDSDSEDDGASRDAQHRYWGAFSQQGMLYISDQGCATRSMLIISGPCRGEVWWDDAANDAGYAPHTVAGARASFFGWYIDWIDRSLNELRAK